MQSFARASLSTAMDHLEAMNDEQLKAEDRKSIQELTKSLEILLHAAKLPDRMRPLDDFCLQLALKCLHSPRSGRGLTQIF